MPITISLVQVGNLYNKDPATKAIARVSMCIDEKNPPKSEADLWKLVQTKEDESTSQGQCFQSIENKNKYRLIPMYVGIGGHDITAPVNMTVLMPKLFKVLDVSHPGTAMFDADNKANRSLPEIDYRSDLVQGTQLKTIVNHHTAIQNGLWVVLAMCITYIVASGIRTRFAEKIGKGYAKTFDKVAYWAIVAVALGCLAGCTYKYGYAEDVITHRNAAYSTLNGKSATAGSFCIVYLLVLLCVALVSTIVDVGVVVGGGWEFEVVDVPLSSRTFVPT